MKMTKFIGALTSAFLISCGYSNGPVSCINRYPNFDSAMEVLSKKENSSPISGLIFNPESIENLDGFAPSFYLEGLCDHNPVHHEFEDLCPDIRVSQWDTFLMGESIKISIHYFVGNKLEAETQGVHLIEMPSAGSAVNYFYEYANAYQGAYRPSEISDFGYIGTYDEDEPSQVSALFASHSRLIANSNGTSLGVVVFSANASSENISNYTSIIEDQWAEK